MDASDSLLVEYGLIESPLDAFRVDYEKIKPIPDSTFALIISTAVEQALELAISTHFKVDEDAIQRIFDESVNGPLGTFAAKIKMGYALGIYPKVIRDELDMMRHIRNTFAHSWEQMTFETQAIIDGCLALELPKRDEAIVESDASTPKAKFLNAARDLYIYLEWDSVAANLGPMLYDAHPGRRMFEPLVKSTGL